ncbi:MAG: hypothetical protein JRI36_11655 [Deltaproteobacteria bacterium]|nr:hypothetical protein [Deltaproteobacteria bacterium]
MKSVLFLGITLLVLVATAFPAVADQISFKATEKNAWELHAQDGQMVGSVKKNETGSLSFYDKTGKYIGVIKPSGTWVPWNARRRVTYIQPEEARLYLDVLAISKQLQ